MAAFLVAAVQMPTASAAWKDLQVLNHTGYAIKNIYITSSGYGKWGKDLLGQYNLSNGSSKTISYNADYTYYDVKIVFMNGAYREWKGNSRINLNGAWRITIYKKGERNGTMIFSISKN